MDELLEELRLASSRLAVLLEGYDDLLRLNLTAVSNAEVEAHRAAAAKRAGLIVGAMNAIRALFENGYPDLPKRDVPTSVIEDMRQNIEGLGIAILEFTTAVTTTGSVVVGPEEVIRDA